MKYYWLIIGGILILSAFAGTFVKDIEDVKTLIIGLTITGVLCLGIGVALRKYNGDKW